MKIIEALKEIPLIEKKIARNIENIQKYAARASNSGDLPFGDDTANKVNIHKWEQSTLDLSKNYEELKRRLGRTNATERLTIGEDTKTITEWLVFRNVTSRFIENAYQAMNTRNIGQIKLSEQDAAQGFQIIRMYDENARNAALEELSEKVGKIDAALEMFNATTDLLV